MRSDTDGKWLAHVQRRQVAILNALYPLVLAQLRAQHTQHECQGQRSVDEEIPVALDFPAVLRVEMYLVGVVAQSAVVEQQSGRRREGVLEAWLLCRCASG